MQQTNYVYVPNPALPDVDEEAESSGTSMASLAPPVVLVASAADAAAAAEGLLMSPVYASKSVSGTTCMDTPVGRASSASAASTSAATPTPASVTKSSPASAGRSTSASKPVVIVKPVPKLATPKTIRGMTTMTPMNTPTWSPGEVPTTNPSKLAASQDVDDELDLNDEADHAYRMLVLMAAAKQRALAVADEAFQAVLSPLRYPDTPTHTHHE